MRHRVKVIPIRQSLVHMSPHPDRSKKQATRDGSDQDKHRRRQALTRKEQTVICTDAEVVPRCGIRFDFAVLMPKA